jgi:multiple antibiotic resistance protein
MREFEKYFIMGFSALLPLINPPGSAFELLGVVGVVDGKSFKVLAKKIAVNSTILLAVVAFGPICSSILWDFR